MLLEMVLLGVKFLYPLHISIYKVKNNEKSDFENLLKYFAIFSIMIAIEYILDAIFIMK